MIVVMTSGVAAPFMVPVFFLPMADQNSHEQKTYDKKKTGNIANPFLAPTPLNFCAPTMEI
jgi:hypothetical protein